MTILQDLSELLYGEGIPMPGLELSHEEAVAIMRRHYRWFEYCLVRDWTWIDLDVTPEQHAQLTKTQREPAIIFARTVIYDSARRWDMGDFVRTSPLHTWRENFIFTTLNSSYLLMGDGVRKRATLDTIANLF